MKRITLSALSLLLSLAFAQAQAVSINTDASNPAPSAILDVKSTDKGVLVPRMTTAQRTAIAAPATGLLVFDSTTGDFWFYNGSSWTNLSGSSYTAGAGIAIVGNTISNTGDLVAVDDITTASVAGGDVTGSFFNLQIAGNAVGSAEIADGAITAADLAPGILPNTLLQDTDGNTRVQVEKNPNEDIIRFDLAGTESMVLRKNASGNARLEMTSDLGNTLLGQNAGSSLINGNNTTAVGTSALSSNTTGTSNVGIGAGALSKNTNRSNLVAVGDSALYNNGLGVNFIYEAAGNTALGSKALFSNTTGFENTANGWQALYANTSGDQNTANGKAALQDNTTGDGNTAGGWEALSSNTTGGGNTATGRAALQYNTSGGSNTAIGISALSVNTTGSQHTAIGASALTTHSTGSRNTALGAEANIGFGNLSNATAIGAKAFVDASNCLVLGSISGINYATESVNVGIGTTTPDVRLQVVGGTDVSLSGGGYFVSGAVTGLNIGIDDNEIMARDNGAAASLFLNNSGGNVKIGNASSKVGIGRSAATNELEVEGTASKSSAGSWLANSDARLKKNISPLNSHETLDKLLALQGVTYEWNDDKTGSKRPEGIQYGFTAQNIQTVFPMLVEEDKLGYLQTAYGTYDAMTVEAIRALNNKIAILEAENAEQKTQNAEMKAQLDKITAALQTAGIALCPKTSGVEQH